MTVCSGPSGTPQWYVSWYSSVLGALLLAEPGSSLQSSHVPELAPSCSRPQRCQASQSYVLTGGSLFPC